MGIVANVLVLALGLLVAAANEAVSPNYVCTDSFSPVTYPEVGTFTADLPCHRRGFPPQHPNKMGTTFRLYTRKNPSSPTVISTSSLGYPFSASNPTKFIIHGFTSNGETSWLLKMKDELLIKCQQTMGVYSFQGDFNVIGVDWKKGASPGLLPDYCQARQNTRVVARQIRNLIKKMQSSFWAFDLDDVHIIGHSLGGQTAGYVGEEFGGKIGRISGIDPAEPDFQGDQTGCRLDPKDAKFVDANHCSMLGIFQPVGHVDIYPNYGTHMPGCVSWPDLLEGQCGHGKAIDYFIDSINNNCGASAYPCTWQTGQGQGCKYSGQSGVSGVKFGYQANQTPSREWSLTIAELKAGDISNDYNPELVI
ncbi:pancreatic lipase-related protein 2-like [Acanthaster planci]|uniref:Pancreatic lipase-related protein 2-like n=1 Tax=Acanthaster planci TaxID=133434 RepID=A0A8B7YRL0_ACAPL|nr:pancreatic lipase-related protein 2-like [Acanthaster planci]